MTREVDRFATELVGHRCEYDGADHDAEVEHRLGRFHQIVLVADQVPLSPRNSVIIIIIIIIPMTMFIVLSS